MNFPLDLRFKLISIAARIAVRDATGQVVLYVRQKAFKLKEDVTIYADEAQMHPLFRIAADRVIDFSAQYHIDAVNGARLGTVRRRGMRSLWRAAYEVERDGRTLFEIREANPWVNVVDGIIGEIPIVGMISGSFFHPRYRVTLAGSGVEVLEAEKQPALFEGRFQISARASQSEDDERLAVIGLLMMLLLERDRG
jgi:hypothetical protein